MGTVYILGAGFSHSAGYPLAGQLISELEKFVEMTNQRDVSFHWNNFKNWVSDQKNELVRLHLATGNPEDIITFLDHVLLSREIVKLQEIFGRLKQKDLKPLLDDEVGVIKARRGLRETLIDFFGWMNWLDHIGRNNEPRRFVHTFCNSVVQEKDVIITFNYDTLAERSLYELGKWSPKDGYGLDVDIKLERWRGDKLVFEDSPTKIFKLHGSTGWFFNPWERRISLDFAHFIPSIRDSNNYAVHDEEDAVLLEPSYIKHVEHIDLQKIWNLAAEAIRTTRKIVIIGYSMPVADSAAQQLICSNIALNSGLEEIILINKRESMYHRYQQVIEFPIKHLHMSFEDWLENVFSNVKTSSYPNAQTHRHL